MWKLRYLNINMKAGLFKGRRSQRNLVFNISTCQSNQLPAQPHIALDPRSHRKGAKNWSSITVCLCNSGHRGALRRCLCGLVCSDGLCSPYSADSGLMEWQSDMWEGVAACCVPCLGSGRGEQAPYPLLPLLSHWWRTDWLWCDLSASSRWCMEQQPRFQSWDASLYTSATLRLNVFPPFFLLPCAGSTQQPRWFALFTKFQSWLHGESRAKVELFVRTLPHLDAEEQKAGRNWLNI